MREREAGADMGGKLRAVIARVMRWIDRDRHQTHIRLSRQRLLQPRHVIAYDRALLNTAGEDDTGKPDFAKEISPGHGLSTALNEGKVRDGPQAWQIIPGLPEGALKAHTEAQDHAHERHQHAYTPEPPGTLAGRSCLVLRLLDELW